MTVASEDGKLPMRCSSCCTYPARSPGWCCDSEYSQSKLLFTQRPHRGLALSQAVFRLRHTLHLIRTISGRPAHDAITKWAFRRPSESWKEGREIAGHVPPTTHADYANLECSLLYFRNGYWKYISSEPFLLCAGYPLEWLRV